MRDESLQRILQALGPKSQWFGGPSPAGSLRGVDIELATRRSVGLKHCIWELALHTAYWEYAVRRSLEGGPKGAFPRSPSNWPLLPEECNERTWASDRQLVKQEREALIRAVECFPAEKLAEPTSGMSDRTYEELLIGIIQHSAYHTGQIALLKRLEGPG